MSAISTMPAAVAQWLGEQPSLQGIRFLTEYPADNKAVPLRNAIVAVGLSTVSITDKFVENDDGVLENQEYCRTASIRLRLGIHVPFSDGGERCHELFTLVLDTLTFSSDLNLRSSGCKEITAQRDTDAFVLEAWADVLADFCPAETTGLAFSSFLPKDLLCGSHISDEDIHLSPQQQAWVNNPFRSGIYLGNGAASMDVALSARPKAVFVACMQYPPVNALFASQTAQTFMGFAAGNYGSMGVEITATGFRVRSGGAYYTVGTTIPALNDSGLQYLYFALM